MQSKNLILPPNRTVEIVREQVPSKRALDPREWIYTAYVAGDGIERAPSIWTLVPHRELATVAGEIRVTAGGDEIHLTGDVYCHAVHCEDGGRPVFSDNYFDLLPGVTKTVRRLTRGVGGKPRFRAIV